MAFSPHPLLFHAIALVFFISTSTGGRVFPSALVKDVKAINTDPTIDALASFAVTQHNRHLANGDSPVILCRVIGAETKWLDLETVCNLKVVVKSIHDGSLRIADTVVFVRNGPDAKMISNYFEFSQNLSGPGEVFPECK
ncbi:hypothetical protein KSP39_PZI008541 [Platanthera zijinensis]|uniref:Uncharacterized protein n=1 Tax=Platanthera zijinensis TaxID=2320716 RepID=A0AAP0BNG5_9ASPA